jgi:hypothetical protein
MCGALDRLLFAIMQCGHYPEADGHTLLNSLPVDVLASIIVASIVASRPANNLESKVDMKAPQQRQLRVFHLVDPAGGRPLKQLVQLMPGPAPTPLPFRSWLSALAAEELCVLTEPYRLAHLGQGRIHSTSRAACAATLEWLQSLQISARTLSPSDDAWRLCFGRFLEAPAWHRQPSS